jgi:hypothetical protein
MTVISSTAHDNDIIRLSKKIAVKIGTLRSLLLDIETAFFFGMVYQLGAQQLTELLSKLFNTSLLDAINEGTHSYDLQDYIVGVVDDAALQQADPQFSMMVPAPDGVLPEMWAAIEITIAESIREVAEKIADTLDHLPTREGEMVFRNLAKLNKQRPTIGVFMAGIKHKREAKNLVIFDVSGSMSESTVRAIVNEVVALAYKANAYLAIVSDHTFYWGVGEADVTSVLTNAEYGGTHYETLASLLNERNWGTVITIADYDSAAAAKQSLANTVRTSIERVIDVSLVDVPTYLSECVGLFAKEVRPILIGTSNRVLH